MLRMDEVSKECNMCRFYKHQACVCQRHAPMIRLLLTTDRYAENYGIWPRVGYNESCGDFEVNPPKPQENK